MIAPALSHTPPLGHAALTPLYDAAIALLTNERRWRRALVDEICAGAHNEIIDVGSGTGSLAALLAKAAPASRYVGVDPDAQAVGIARRKSAQSGANATFVHGFFAEAAPDAKADVVVSSLVLHQVPLDEKRRIIAAAFESLKSGGRILIADYGRQGSKLSKVLFRATVQALDGVENTQPNADGVLPVIMTQSGFSAVNERHRFVSLTGEICIYRGERAV